VLPIHEPDYRPITELDALTATPRPRFEVKAPESAPNVLIVLIDDMGFGIPSALGGPVHMPTSDRLAGGEGELAAFQHALKVAPAGKRGADRRHATSCVYSLAARNWTPPWTPVRGTCES
jgi:hypothetical protein